MNYRHIFHAGNFADVFKHIVLVGLMNAMNRKEAPYCFMDTHAGVGLYDLNAPQLKKTAEYKTGIDKILAARNRPALVDQYLQYVLAVNPTIDPIQFYPGSPKIAQQLLRLNDRAVLTEMHEDDGLALKKIFRQDKRVAAHLLDGYQGMKAFLPPKERRGLILIDPPYEEANELDQMPARLGTCLKRFETGVFALWYPIKLLKPIERFHHQLDEHIQRPRLCLELSIYPENTATHLNGSGMLIINPPWQFEQEMQSVLPWLWETLSPNKQGRLSITS